MGGAKAGASSKKRASTVSVAVGKEKKETKETNAEAEEDPRAVRGSNRSENFHQKMRVAFGSVN